MDKTVKNRSLIIIASAIWLNIAVLFALKYGKDSVYVDGWVRIKFSSVKFFEILMSIGLLPVLLAMLVLFLIGKTRGYNDNLIEKEAKTGEGNDLLDEQETMRKRLNAIKLFLLNKYEIYTYDDEIIDAIKIGWSWPAFLFPLLWMFAKRLWGGFFLVSIVMLITNWIYNSANLNRGSGDRIFWYFIFMLIVRFICGYFGNRWLVNKLLTSDFRMKGRVMARKKNHAINKYLKSLDTINGNNT